MLYNHFIYKITYKFNKNVLYIIYDDLKANTNDHIPIKMCY